MTASHWKPTRLVDIAAPTRWALNGGPFGSKLTTKHYVESGVPVIRGTNLSGGLRFSFDDFVYVTEEKADELLSNNAHPGDMVFTQRGTIGQVGLIPRDSPYQRFVISQSQMKLTPDSSKADTEFLYLLFTVPDTVRRLQDLAFAAGVPHINLDILRQFRVLLPPLPQQRRIAEFLSAFDAFIGNNLRRIQILEEMIRAIYREWFVHFRFPGHEGVALVDSPLGPIPEAWEVKPLSSIATVNRAQVRTDGAPAQIHYIDISSVSPGRIESTTMYVFSEAPGRARRIVAHGDVLWSCVRPNRRSHALVLNPRPHTVASTGFAVITATQAPYTFVYQATTTDEFVTYLSNHATGAAYPAVTAATFDQANLVIPTPSVLEEFGAITIPMAELVNVLQQQVDNLRATRDHLLPRLMSGQLTLPEAEAAAAASL